MTKLYTLLFLLLLSTGAAFGQALVISPGSYPVLPPDTSEESITKDGPGTDYEIVVYGNVLNNTDQTYTIKWQRIGNELNGTDSEGNGWRSLVCDTVTCWSSSRDSSSFQLAGGEHSRLDVHFQSSPVTPDLGNGDGIVTLHVWAVEDSANVNATMAYEVSTWATGIEEAEMEMLSDENMVEIYPIPFQYELNIDMHPKAEIQNIEVYNLIGKKMSDCYITESLDSFIIDTSDFEEGMYFICFYNRSNELLMTRLVSKVD